jgi:putative DNA methylase
MLKQGGSREFRLAEEGDLQTARKASEALSIMESRQKTPLPLVPNEPSPESRGPGASRAFSIRKYGMHTWGNIFTRRQTLSLNIFSREIQAAHKLISNEHGDPQFAKAIVTCLSLVESNLSHYLSSISIYALDHMISAFVQGSGLPMRPDFAEANPMIPKLVGGFEYSHEQMMQFLEREGSQDFHSGIIQHGTATSIPLPDHSVQYVVTDPPYYDQVPYAALSDFCYVWLKRVAGNLYPDIFAFALTPKAEECIWDPGLPPPGEPEKDRTFFEATMEQALHESQRILHPHGLAVVLFAHKDTSGWEALLNSVLNAGWTIAASWPIETERGARLRAKNSAVLASSVFLVCRPRSEKPAVGEWRKVLLDLNQRVGEWLIRLTKEGIEGADAIFASLGPALEVYSQYERVETAGGQVIPLADVKDAVGQVVQRGYLSYVWETVAREALKVIFTEADPAGFEEDARLTAMWLWSIRSRLVSKKAVAAIEGPLPEEAEEAEPIREKNAKGFTLPYDDARLLIQALGAHEDPLRKPGSILEIKGEKARLLSVAERRRFLLGERTPGAQQGKPLFKGLEGGFGLDSPIEPGGTALDRLHQAMLLFAEGQSGALRWFLVNQGVGREAHFWRLADTLSKLYPPASHEKRWVDGIIARRKVLGL